MKRKECIAMVLAGGRGARLGALTRNVAKPAVYFGGKYRIIDFTLSNCSHSGIDTVGVLTQYSPLGLHNYVDDGGAWRLDGTGGSLTLLPSSAAARPYSGTANAVFQNAAFINRFSPEYVLILPGNQVCAMDYGKLLAFAKEKDARAVVAVTHGPGLGAVLTEPDGAVRSFAPETGRGSGGGLKGVPASTGVYLFRWPLLKRALAADKSNARSRHDFGRDIIPAMLGAGEKLYAYHFSGYWRSVGTVLSLWESNMDMLNGSSGLDPGDKSWEIYTKRGLRLDNSLSPKAAVERSIIEDGCDIYGKVTRSVLSDSVTISAGAQVCDSVIMPGAFIGRGAKIHKAIIGADAVIGENVEIGVAGGMNMFTDDTICAKGVSLIGPGICVNKGVKIQKNSHIYREVLAHKKQDMVVNREAVRLELAYV